MDYSNALIYGKNPTLRIVGCEIHDGFARLFKLDENLDTIVEEIPSRPWILSNVTMGRNGVQLQGTQHYRFGKQYPTIAEFDDARKLVKRYDYFTVHNLKENAMLNKGFTYFKGLDPKDVPILAFDIESTTLKHTNEAKVILISNTFRKGKYIEKRLFSYDEYANYGDMFTDWCNWVRLKDPAIIVGHNIFGYDLPYLIHVAEMNGVKLLLGRDKSEVKVNNYNSQYRIDGSNSLTYKKINIYGREIIDTMFLSYRYDQATKKYENYKLKYIIQKEGLEKKDRVFYDASQIKNNYTNPEEFKKIKEYCIDDSDDALALFDLMIPPFFYMNQMIPKPAQEMMLSATGSQINSLMIRSYLQERYSIAKADDKCEYEGAISFGIPGIYRNVIKIDVASLYPSIQLQYSVYPKHKDPKANLLNFLKEMRNLRLYHKKMGKETGLAFHKHMDSSAKILINSMYGAMGASGLNYNYPAGAATVTRIGREIISKTIEWASGKNLAYWGELFQEKTGNGSILDFTGVDDGV